MHAVSDNPNAFIELLAAQADIEAIDTVRGVHCLAAYCDRCPADGMRCMPMADVPACSDTIYAG